ncbi:MAG: hypothetical protein J5565_05570 [Muribaculaceae bacterium]|nr:hypothetical protein [Muribaculaceae bacterium]
MKKIYLLIAVALTAMATVSCGNAENNADGTDSTATEQTTETAAVNPWPWDFPQNVKIEAEEGQWVLSPYTFYPGALKDGEDPAEKVLIFYSTKMTSVGDTKSTVNNDVEMPNALIIPLAKDAQAKKGDILLTWWQKGSGMKRAIVKDASNPAEPKVDYLDMEYSDDPEKPGFAQREADQQLKPGTFNILTDGEWQPGAQVACKNDRGEWDAATLLYEQDSKVLVLGFSDKVKAYKKDDVKLIPFKENINVGDKVYAKWVAGYKEGYTVTKVDKNLGRYWVEKDGKTEVKAFGEVTKLL